MGAPFSSRATPFTVAICAQAGAAKINASRVPSMVVMYRFFISASRLVDVVERHLGLPALIAKIRPGQFGNLAGPLV